jgi:hypothetical protein
MLICVIKRRKTKVIYTRSKSKFGRCNYQNGQTFFVKVMCLVDRSFHIYLSGSNFYSESEGKSGEMDEFTKVSMT